MAIEKLKINYKFQK